MRKTSASFFQAFHPCALPVMLAVFCTLGCSDTDSPSASETAPEQQNTQPPDPTTSGATKSEDPGEETVQTEPDGSDETGGDETGWTDDTSATDETSETGTDETGTTGSAGPEGCYDPVAHVCDCDTDEATCAEKGGIWTDACEC